MVDAAANFTGSIPEYYDSILGPAQFEPFAADLMRRMPVRPKGDVLELACGTGIVTGRLRERVDSKFRLVATDLSEAMLAHARHKVKGKIDWRVADAAALPFKDQTFGAVVCAFGVMFVPDKQKLFAEARRVLVEGGLLLFNVWDRIERNLHATANAEVMEAMFPGDPQMQFGKLPYGYCDEGAIREHLHEARFSDVRIDSVKIGITAPSARAYANGQVRGTPRALLIQQKGANLDEVVEKVAAKLAALGGAEPFRIDGHALVVQAKAV
ncbi:MAG TPA: methyltransferase domain-containing protein [Burkholderiales bacterium]|nr:methyltransferase domain-containing protein [Burkholderiales bacterium]